MSRNMLKLLAIFIVFLVIFEVMVYVATTPPQQEQFIQLYVSGANRLAQDYYPSGDPDIRLGDAVTWYVGVTNSMDKVQLVEVRVKLGNQTIMPPDDLKTQPSPAPLITEFKRVIQNNETWEIPFVWFISNAAFVKGSTYILDLGINDETYQLLGSSARNGYDFRLLFELWTWQVESGAFQFGWSVGTERRVAWVQIWFNMTGQIRRVELQSRRIPGTIAKACSSRAYNSLLVTMSANIGAPITLPPVNAKSLRARPCENFSRGRDRSEERRRPAARRCDFALHSS